LLATSFAAVTKDERQIMNVEFDQEYAVLKDKVRELREYL